MSIALDMAKLDKEAILLVTEFEKVIPQLKELESQLIELKWQLDKMYAELYKEYKSGITKKTEKQVESEILTTPEYQELMDKYLEVKKQYLTLKAKRDILYQKYNGIQTLLDLFKVRYFGDMVDLDILQERTKEIKNNIDFKQLDKVLNGE